MTTPNNPTPNRPTPPEGMRLSYGERFILFAGVKWLAMNGWFDVPECRIGSEAYHLTYYAIPITPTVPATGDSARQRVKSGDPEYFCQWCYDHGLRYPDDGLPWRHSNQCPNRPQATGDTEAHHEHCDTLDPIIKGKPCNCKGRLMGDTTNEIRERGICCFQGCPTRVTHYLGESPDCIYHQMEEIDTTNEKGGEQQQELLQCPFCGSAPRSYDVNGETPDGEGYGYWAVECPKCNGGEIGRFCGVHGEDKEDAETKWNTRK